MYQTIDEEIAVAGVFQHKKFLPKKFLWREKTYIIHEITLHTLIKEHGEQSQQLACIAGGAHDVFRLSFDQKNNQWKLREIWIEGA